MQKPSDNDDKTRATSAKAPAKKAYSKPVLRSYGQVHKLTHGASGSVGDGTGMLMAPSDRRLKQNIVRIGTHADLGIGLYLFDYLPGLGIDGRQFGVMADEVEAVMPGAVSVGVSGYKQVRYDMLGISQA